MTEREIAVALVAFVAGGAMDHWLFPVVIGLWRRLVRRSRGR